MPDDKEPKVSEANLEKMYLRGRLVVDDALERLEKHGAFEMFKKE
jgi:hypothetical protein